MAAAQAEAEAEAEAAAAAAGGRAAVREEAASGGGALQAAWGVQIGGQPRGRVVLRGTSLR